jgi:hypothetical protein
MTWDRNFTLLDQAMRVDANRTITNAFTVPVNAPYEISIYVEAKVPYADCLLGQGGYLEERCSPYHRVIDVAWLVHDKDGRVLREGVSEGTCCSYTADEHKNPVVFTTLGDFKLAAGTTAYLELKNRRDVSQLENLEPRIAVQRSDPMESELGLELWSLLGIGALLLISLVLLIVTWSQYRAQASRQYGTQ